MTLDEAIAHAWEVSDKEGCTECGINHMQLAGWLEELKAKREAEADKDVTRLLPLPAPLHPENGLLICGTAEEINEVLHTINPDFPRQNFENAGRVCSYRFGETWVTLHVRKEEEEK